MAGVERAGKEDEAVRPALHHAMVEAEDRPIVGHLLDPEEGLLHVARLVLGVVEQAAIDLGRRLLQERRGFGGGAQLLGRVGCLIVPLVRREPREPVRQIGPQPAEQNAPIGRVDPLDDGGIPCLLGIVPSGGLVQARELVGGEIEVIARLRVEQPADLVDLRRRCRRRRRGPPRARRDRSCRSPGSPDWPRGSGRRAPPPPRRRDPL